jgi:D-alanyl-D-alanine carboxypeptidase
LLQTVSLAVLLLVACTLDITTPETLPPNTWDSSWNTHPDGALFQEMLNRHVKDGLPGVVLLVRTPNGLWNGAAGYAKLETAIPMTPTHRHFAASVTKMYMATAVLMLVEDGLLELDAKLETYLPASTLNPIPNGKNSTVRQLLGHTSGIPSFTDAFHYELDTLNDPLGSYPPQRLLSYVYGESALFEPGEGYFYSNTNYLLLALLMDVTTGASHADVISERLLQPLGLQETWYKNEAGYPTPSGLVNSYEDLGGDGRLMNVSDLVIHANAAYQGNTGMIATSADFAAFIEALLQGNILQPASLDTMLSSTRCACYGLGLSFRETPYGTAVGHSGGDLGILSEVRYFPERDTTVVLLVNGGDSGVPQSLFRRLWDQTLDVAFASGG